MTPRDAASNTPTASLTAIVVEPILADVWFAASGLADSFHLTVAETFLEAKALIDEQRPALLITDLRLHEYNGLHLVLRGKAARPDMAAVVVTTVADPVLQAEAERLKATFVLKPTTRQEFLAAVHRTLFRSVADATPIRPPFERRSAERRVEKVTRDAERRSAERRRVGASSAEDEQVT